MSRIIASLKLHFTATCGNLIATGYCPDCPGRVIAVILFNQCQHHLQGANGAGTGHTSFGNKQCSISQLTPGELLTEERLVIRVCRAGLII